jgi:hypothetical protein
VFSLGFIENQRSINFAAEPELAKTNPPRKKAEKEYQTLHFCSSK